MQKSHKILSVVVGLLGVYALGYAWARVFVFHAVESYAGAEGKSLPRQDYIAKKDGPAGEGWQYRVFLPAIATEEAIINHFHNR
jgi:hypothetical protein